MLGKVWTFAPWKAAWRQGPSLHHHLRQSFGFPSAPTGSSSSYSAGGAKWSTGSRAWSQLTNNNTVNSGEGVPGYRLDDENTEELEKVQILRTSRPTILSGASRGPVPSTRTNNNRINDESALDGNTNNNSTAAARPRITRRHSSTAIDYPENQPDYHELPSQEQLHSTTNPEFFTEQQQLTDFLFEQRPRPDVPYNPSSSSVPSSPAPFDLFPNWSSPTSASKDYKTLILDALKSENPAEVLRQVEQYRKADPIDRSHQTDNAALNALISTHAAAGDLTEILALYDDMLHHNVDISKETYGLMIRAFCAREKAINDLSEEFLSTHEKLQLASKSTPWSHGWVNKLEPNLQDEAYLNAPDQLTSHQKQLNSKLLELTKQDYFPAAKKIFVTLQPNALNLDTLAYDSLLSVASTRSGELDFSLQVFYAQERSRAKNSRPSPETYYHLINLYTLNKDIDGARLVFEGYLKAKFDGVFNNNNNSIKSSDSREQSVWNAMISAEMAIGETDKALELVEQMTLADSSSHSTATTKAAQSGDAQIPSAPTLTTSSFEQIINGFVQQGDYSTAKRWFDRFLHHPREDNLPTAAADFYLSLLSSLIDQNARDLTNHVFSSFLSEPPLVINESKVAALWDSIVDINLSLALNEEADTDKQNQALDDILALHSKLKSFCKDYHVQDSILSSPLCMSFDRSRCLIHTLSLRDRHQDAASIFKHLYQNVYKNLSSYPTRKAALSMQQTDLVSLLSLQYSLVFSILGLAITSPPRPPPTERAQFSAYLTDLYSNISTEQPSESSQTEQIKVPYDTFVSIVAKVAQLPHSKPMHPKLVQVLLQNYQAPQKLRTSQEWGCIISWIYAVETARGTTNRFSPDKPSLLDQVFGDLEAQLDSNSDLSSATNSIEKEINKAKTFFNSGNFGTGLSLYQAFKSLDEFYGPRGKDWKDILVKANLFFYLPSIEAQPSDNANSNDTNTDANNANSYTNTNTNTSNYNMSSEESTNSPFPDSAPDRSTTATETSSQPSSQSVSTTEPSSISSSSPSATTSSISTPMPSSPSMSVLNSANSSSMGYHQSMVETASPFSQPHFQAQAQAHPQSQFGKPRLSKRRIPEEQIRKIERIYAKNPDAAYNIVKEAVTKKNNWIPTRVASMIIDAYARRVRAALNLGNSTHKEEIEWLYAIGYQFLTYERDPNASWKEWEKLENMMIMAYSSLGIAERVNVHRHRLFFYGFAPSADAYGTMIAKSQDTTDDASVAIALFGEACQLGVKPNTYLYNTLMSKLTRARRTSLALGYFDEMKLINLKPSTVTYGTVINAATRIGDMDMAKDLFIEMGNQSDYKKSIPPFNTMMQGFIHTKGDRESALTYFQAIIDAGLSPSEHTYKLLLDAFGAIEPQDLSSVEDVFKRLAHDPEVRINADHFASLIYIYGTKAGDLEKAIEIFEDIPNCRLKYRLNEKNGRLPDAIVYESLFKAFVTHNRFDLVEKYRNRKRQEGVRMTAYVANCLIEGYGSVGLIDKARELFESMGDPQRGVAAPFNHPKSTATNPMLQQVQMERRPVEAWKNVYREPSTYEAMIKAELAQGNQKEAYNVLNRSKQRGFPAPIVNSMENLITSFS